MSPKPLFGMLLFLVCSAGASLNIKPQPEDFKLQSTVALVERILVEASAIPIETYSFAFTNESFIQAVIDHVAWRFDTLMLPMFNNALSWFVQTRQLILIGVDDFDTLMLMRWFNKELDHGNMDILIDRSFRSDVASVRYVLPEMNGVCLIVPKTKKYNVLQHLLRPFASTAWSLLLAALIVGSCIAQRYFRNSLLATLIFGVDLDAASVSRRERIILFGSLVMFFILSEAYQAKLLALMSSSRYPLDPKTVAEFLQTDTMLHVGEATATVLSFRPSLKGRVRIIDNYDISFDGEKDFGILMQCPIAWDWFMRSIHLQHNLYGYNVRSQVHIVGEHILSLPASFTFSRNFLLYAQFKGYLDRIFESGLMRYWQTEHDRERLFEQKFEFVENSIISFNDLLMVWIVLGIGNGIALGVFLIEVMFHFLKRYVGNRWPSRRQQRLFVKSKQCREILRLKA
uniref:Ionotropic glutamate receptor C-terminal domain-containing protein n=1 Tax=Anopheles epiroticus TaxID=199890 RepID=A0A182P0F8_9DIPT